MRCHSTTTPLAALRPNSLLALGAQRPHLGTGLPHLAVGNLLQFLLQLLPVVWSAVGIQRAPRLLAAGDRLVELLEDRLGGVAERLEPVESAALRGGGAVRVHPVHALL